MGGGEKELDGIFLLFQISVSVLILECYIWEKLFERIFRYKNKKVQKKKKN